MRRLLLTGASGFIGTNLLASWKGRYEAILNLDSRPPFDATYQSFWHKADLLVPEEWTRQVADFQPTEVIHLAARTDMSFIWPPGLIWMKQQLPRLAIG